MSIGMYLASDHKLTTTPQSASSELLSINDLKKYENYATLISNLKTNLGIDPQASDPNEKLFVLLDDEEEVFSVMRDRDEGTINQYTDKPFIYYVDIYNWEQFYQSFANYLQSLQAPFELWEIWEGTVDLQALETVQLDELNEQALEKLFGNNEYSNPVVGVY
ncbi:hypothetical protein P7D85_13585 [Enterococcus hulanensis]|uniref:Uncharacterized protein n=1 Tax=Enterococcus hulanensis TaxID=2559929 RepID=A0ABU3F100_9ENTE|nr:hypothetical protein [Enterococcus hulanensis]MDT2600814.1 hypothetical protein [Enterococcus hulanensis]MDT2611965.1 hypothetical protein [Enterococcus hulanensis]MDT2618113.1 hypothetical protein [Enterococcus hulanensis]MDT2629116.1 hypothetical protein [Enterococcus hulanensis]MDT2656678.1 hypothetical protein [Enterococcus hulanensis]